jgi:YlmC/YmxH family sporulation protein
MLVKASELRLLDVININDGRRLGNVIDLDIDLDTGEIKAIILPGPGRLLWFFNRGGDVAIPWPAIVKIGVDVILVDTKDNLG